jgi:hypothetical protein
MLNESVVRSSALSNVDEDKRESAHAWRTVIVWSILILAVTSIPYLFAYVTAPADSEFMGIIYNVHDYGAYRSWIRQAGQGFLIQDQLTSEPNEPVIFNPLWIILGKTESALGLSFPQLFQIERWVAGLTLLLIAYNFFGRFFADRTQRLFAFLFFGLSSGFGWVLVLLNKLGVRIDAPLDIYLAPGNTLVSLMTSPHFAVALILLLVTFSLVLDGCEKRQWRYWIGAGLSALFLGLVHYELVTVYAVLAAFLGLTWLRDRFNFRWITSGLIVFAL